MVLQAILGSSYSSRRNASRSRSRAKYPSSDAAVDADNGAADDAGSSPDDAAIAANTRYIHDEAQLRRLPPESPDLRELNNSLEALAVVFPDVQVEVFREMLAHFDGESRLYVVADALLKNSVNWVKGRWRLNEDNQGRGAGKDAQADADADAYEATASENKGDDATERLPRIIPPKESFRSDEYQKAVKALAWHEFRGLPRSTIHGVLAESNYDYLDARNTLVDLSSKSWRFSISAFLFSRRKPTAASAPPPNTSASGNDAENHPLVTWKSTGHGGIVPTVRATGSPELDRELYNRLVKSIRRKARAAQEEKDREMAGLLNADEAEREGALYECCCCFADAAFEEFVQCDADAGHLICFECVRRSLSEAVFGQGWRSSIDPPAGTLRCVAVDGGGCEDGRVPVQHLRRAMLEGKKGDDILRRLDRRLAEHSLLASGLPLVRCPFCDYAEIDDVYLPQGESRLRLRLDSLVNLFFLLVCLGTIPLLRPLVLTSLLATLLLLLGTRFATDIFPAPNNNINGAPTNPALPSASGPGGATAPTSISPLDIKTHWSQAVNRHRRRRRGAKFTCLDPMCGQSSCLSCHKAWVDIHVCNESSLVALRTQVEQAMSLAVKRVCPRCGTSFVKNSGCNKLTCPCGYKMCYVCRKDIGGSGDGGGDGGGGGGGEGYRHFCDHFRPEGDPTPCTQCDRCNLWESEDTEAVLREAREEAERKWRLAEERGEAGLSGSEQRFLETGYASSSGGRSAGAATPATADLSLDALVRRGRLPTAGELCDVVLAYLFV